MKPNEKLLRQFIDDLPENLTEDQRENIKDAIIDYFAQKERKTTFYDDAYDDYAC